MDNKTNNHNGFGNGFVLGLLVGIVATLFITTKRGRELFKELTEKGLDKFSDLEDSLKASKDEYDEIDEEDDYVPVEPRSVKLAKEDLPEKRSTSAEASLDREDKQHGGSNGQSSHSPRRFFRSRKS